MNWRRGLAFALMHLTVAVPLIVWQEAQVWRQLPTRSSTATLRLAAFQEGQASWDPTTICYWVTPPEAIVRYVNLPASILAGWHYPPHSNFTIAGASEAVFGKVTRASIVTTAIGFTMLIFVQWLVVAAAPVIRPKRRWLEPAVLVSVCGGLSVCALLAAPQNGMYAIPLMIAIVTWFVWVGVVLAKLARLGRMFAAHRRSPRNLE